MLQFGKQMLVSRLVICFAMLIAVGLTLPVKGEAELGVLFLGDNGAHRPYERMRQIVGPLAEGGVHVTYTTRLEDLNDEHLAKYDAVIIYANHTKIEPDQEKALLDYVKNGGGLVPLHSASFCFLNSPKYIELVGAQFKSHKSGVFRTRVAKADHPIMKDLKAIESWDETYVHTKHNEDRVVLSYRDEAGKAEPWTWVRNHGKGRVFYTAWGHDQRTWSNKEFQQLVLRGVRWAAGVSGEKLYEKIERPAFKYVEEEIPYYPPSQNWGTMGDDWKKMQLPLSPEDSMKHMLTPKEFKVELFASEPLLKGKPIAMAWDAKGRLWVAETVDYPNEMQPKGKGRDSIVILEDTDGDGKADKRKVFVDKLSVPTSLTFGGGGLIVHQAPETILFKDNDGDDKADERVVLIKGWNTNDTHAGPSNLRYGLDNWIWGMQGYAGINAMVGGEHHHFRMGFYRFKANGEKMEFLRKSNNNTWGLGFSEDGLVFGSTANNNPSMFLPISEQYYNKVAGMQASVLPTIANTSQFIPITKLIRQVDVHGGYTAAAGHALYTARAYPKDYWNRKAFVAGPTGKLLGVFNLYPKGAGYTASNGYNLVESFDEWSAPIVAEVGPDGQVWVIDWYNYIVQHNPTPKGYKTGKGNAYLTKLRDKKRGRIYRVVHTGDSRQSMKGNLDLTKATPSELVKTLKHSNMLWRLHAQRLLVERGEQDVVPQLIELARDLSVDEIGLNVGAIHALWTLHGLNAIQGEGLNAAIGALMHPSHGVRRNAVQVLPDTMGTGDMIVKAGLLEDKHVQVQLAALLKLSDIPSNKIVAEAIYKQLASGAYEGDRELTDAVTIASAVHAYPYIQTVLAETPARDMPAWMAGRKDKVERQPVNLILNPSFENASDGQPVGWAVRNYSGQATHKWVKGGRSGDHAMYISSEGGSDTSWFTTVKVKPDTQYELSAWIKTKNVNTRGGAHGAMLNVHEIQAEGKTNQLKATNDKWTFVKVRFNSGRRNQLTINLLFGGWGPATGEAWYDDVSLTEVGGAAEASVDTGLNKQLDLVTRRVVRHIGMSGEEAAARLLFEKVNQADPQLLVGLGVRLADTWKGGAEIILTQDEVKKIVKELDAKPKGFSKPVAMLLAKAGHAGAVEHITGKLQTGDADKVKYHEIKLGVIKDQMKFDKKALKVKAGEKVRVVFSNTDHMQHNFLLLKSGTLEKVGNMADQMLTDPKAMEKQYIPDTPDVLAYSPLVNPHERAVITFTAPAEPGEYPYVCTFPGHWRIMQGVLTVE